MALTEHQSPAPSPPATEPTEAPTGSPRRDLAWYAPWLVVALAMGWGLWALRPELRAVPYLDDSSIHQQMVRFAATRVSQGHLPLTSWFPYLGLGSPQYLHYQSLPSMTAGLFGTFIDPDTVFRWSLYLLLALWPLTVYWCARLFGLSRWTAAAAAAVSPFLASVPGIGYEAQAYVWRGYGVWTQLWASWTLPLAWGFSYRALRSVRRQALLPAVLFIMITVALHFETGYLAFVPLVVWPFIVPSDLWRRLGRAVLVGGCALLASAWVIVPLLAQSHWAARNQVLEGTGLENGYGARQMLDWLFTGRLFDDGFSLFGVPFPAITVLVGVGIVACVVWWRTFVAGRAIVSIFVVTLLMTFGRTTFGSLYSVIPGSSDVFIRRFELGVQLSGLLLAGIGIVAVGRLALGALRSALSESRRRRLATPAGRALVAGISIVALAAVLAPAFIYMDAYESQNGTNVSLQAQADSQEAPQLDRLLDYVEANPRGRVYAGSPTNWGAAFTVGDVPVFKYLESKDVDEVGYTLRTASLMTDPEYWFDEYNAGDYPLFGIGYVIVPEGMTPPVAADRVDCQGQYCLYALPDPGYVHVYDTVGTLTATRADIGTQSEALLDSPLLADQRDDTVAFNGGTAAPPTASDASALRGPPGRVVTEDANLAAGEVHAVVKTNRTATIVLSASYDPGWTATVDGQPRPTVMVAPALVGVVVGPGVHDVAFRYGGYGSYPALFALALLVFLGIAVGPLLWTLWRRVRRGGRGAPGTPGVRGTPGEPGETQLVGAGPAGEQ